ncbi:MAG: rod shape-determining protein MreC [Bacteroidales bacterium]|nr:rod shape-determining protein MreC [Bacteroidales bacterium]
MSKSNSLGSILTIAAIFIILEIAAIAMLSRSSTLQNIWINRASHKVTAALWGGGQRVMDFFSMEKRMEELATENAELERQLRSYQLKEYMAAEAGSGPASIDDAFRFIPASIVKISRNTAHNYIVLNKGYADGIKPQSGIISSKGVIGIVSAVDEHYCYGLTLMNTNISISARVKNSDYLAPVVWDGIHKNGAYMKDLPLHHTVHPGDTIVTSGHSSIFPPDIPVGIAGESSAVDGSVQNVKVTLFQDFATVRYATIVNNTKKDEIAEIEQKGEEQL